MNVKISEKNLNVTKFEVIFIYVQENSEILKKKQLLIEASLFNQKDSGLKNKSKINFVGSCASRHFIKSKPFFCTFLSN